MTYVPHEYQRYSTDFIKAHPEAAVFLDCGLGKTVITLTALIDLLFDSFEIYKALVIAPLRVRCMIVQLKPLLRFFRKKSKSAHKCTRMHIPAH